MTFTPLRLPPGADLRRSLDTHTFPDGSCSGFVVAGLGILMNPKLRFAVASEETTISGPVELMTISGSLSKDGAHVHVAVANAQGQLFAGHLCYGSVVRTTVELLLAPVPGFELHRTHDTATGFKELVVYPAVPKAPGNA